MTIRTFLLLGKLKRAQLDLNELVYIDHDAMTASTVHESGKPIKIVKLKFYRTSLDATLRYLQKLEYIDYDEDHDVVQVLYSGWYSFGATVQSAVKFTIRDVFVPVVVAVITAVITTAIMN